MTPAPRSKFAVFLNDLTRRKVDEMAEYYDSNASQVIRDAISFYFDKEYRKNALGYQSGGLTGMNRAAKGDKASETEKTVESILAMTDEEATAFICTLDPEFENLDEDGFGVRERRFVIRTDVLDGVRKFYTTQYDLTKERETYSKEISTLEQFINSLKREKKI